MPSLFSRSAKQRRPEDNSYNAQTTNSNFGPSYGSPPYERIVLEPHDIILRTSQLDTRQWGNLAFSLGIPADVARVAYHEVKKAPSKIRQRSKAPNHEAISLFDAIFWTAAKEHQKVSWKIDIPFWRNSMPPKKPNNYNGPQWAADLPTPQPAITFGYKMGAFRQRFIELQNGIISNVDNEPCNLAQISQPLPELYWPFLVVESLPPAADGSSLPVQHACAGTGATCNNALMILSEAAHRHKEIGASPTLPWDSLRPAQSFSIGINGKTATLNSHNSAANLPHSMTAVRSYSLEDEKDIQALYSRVIGIMVWAENSRLPAILEVLDMLDRRVHSGLPSKTPIKTDFDAKIWEERYGNEKKTRARSFSSVWQKVLTIIRLAGQLQEAHTRGRST